MKKEEKKICDKDNSKKQIHFERERERRGKNLIKERTIFSEPKNRMRISIK